MFTPLSQLDFSRGVPQIGGSSEEDNLIRIVKDALADTNQRDVEALKVKIAQFLNTKPKEQAEKLSQICNPLFDRTELVFANGEKLVINQNQRAKLIEKCDYFSSIFTGRMAIDLNFPYVLKEDFVKFLDLLDLLVTGNDLNYPLAEIDDFIFIGRRFSLNANDLQRLISNINLRIEFYNFTTDDSIEEFVQMYEAWHDREDYKEAFQKTFSHLDKEDKHISTKNFIQILSKIKDRTNIKSIVITAKCSTEDLKAILSLAPNATNLVFEKERSLADDELDLLHNMTSIVFPVMNPFNMALTRFRENNPNLESVRFNFPNNDFILAIPQYIKTIELEQSDLLSASFWENLSQFPSLSVLRTDAEVTANNIITIIPKLKVLELTCTEGINFEFLRRISLLGTNLDILSIKQLNVDTPIEEEMFGILNVKTVIIGSGYNADRLKLILKSIPFVETLKLNYNGLLYPLFKASFDLLASLKHLKHLELGHVDWRLDWTSNITHPSIESINLVESNFAVDFTFFEKITPLDNVANLLKLCPNLKVLYLSRTKYNRKFTNQMQAKFPSINFIFVDS